MKVAVVVYPGSNADWDALHTARAVLGAEARYVFHKERELGDVDAVIVPGGFAYGDYLRAGAICGLSPISEALRAFAARGGPVLGICNGFQVLTELGLLPGALTRNAHLRFECRDVWVRVDGEGAFTKQMVGRVLRLPVAHAEGRYQCDAETLARIEGEGQVALRYCDPEGRPGPSVNGSVSAIAGVYDPDKRVLGLMPHPERASEAVLGNDDGKTLFDSLAAHLEGLAG
jgi:phosphoribosylformylglycinamidine synthase I